MGNTLEYPKLRWPLDIRLERLENQEVLLLTCPLGIADKPLFLIPAIGPVIACFEGNLSVQEIARKFEAQGLKVELVRELVQLLDQHKFLASPAYFTAEKLVKEEFLRSSTRQPALAGSGYTAVPEDLAKEIDRYLGSPISNGTHLSTMVGLVSPHIDYRRGGLAYGATYAHLREQEHDLYIVIGTAHQYSRLMFHLTRKDFPTPLGNLPTDVDFVEKLAHRYGHERSFADELLHRREHSLELQLPFLHRLKRDAKVVPILVGGFHHMLDTGKFPESFEEYDRFAASLSEVINEAISEGKRICFVAGVDMAHVGQSFGDKFKLSDEYMKQVEQRDSIYLDTIKDHDKHRLFQHIAEDSDQRRICGFPTMYTVLDVMERLGMNYTAQVFDYRQAVDHERQCAVTFAGLGMYFDDTTPQ